jgi:dihydrofolate reductase
MKAIVVAVDRNNGIGADNDLLWQRDLPADLRHFKEITTGGTVIMGRKTYESIGRPLPGRENIVVSRSGFAVDGVIGAKSLAEAYQKATRENVYIIGGGQIYDQALNDMDKLYITQVDAEFPQATVFFPRVDCMAWQETSREHYEADEKNKYDYDFVEFEPVKE